MHLFADRAEREQAAFPAVLIVDHGLRAESGAEAAMVAQWARALGFTAHVLTWRGAKPGSGIEAKARAARYRLLGAWCATHRAPNLLVAHTREDQAETFLLRLGRGSGVDGLSGMKPVAPLPVAGFEGMRLLRPLLDIGRAELRAYLAAQGARWLEDPMNEDSRFARARIRKALPALEAAGISVKRIAEAARHLARARAALDAATDAFLADRVHWIGADCALIDGAALGKIHREIGLRALSAVLMRIADAGYRPRFERLEALFDAIASGACAARTLCGCRIAKAPKAKAAFGPQTLAVTRERPRRSSGKAEKDEERPVEADKVARVKPADMPADLAARNRDQLVDH